MCIRKIFNYLFINNKKNKILNTNYTDNINDYNNNVNDKLIDDNTPLFINGELYVECNLCFNICNLKDLPLLYPCGHRLYCKLCVKKIINNANNCPSCRENILDTIRIYENFEKVDNNTKLNIT